MTLLITQWRGLRLFGRARITRDRTTPSGSAQTGDVEASLSEGDRLRDAGEFAAAARIYGAVLESAPGRVDIQVQQGNMLKDSGQLAEAEAVYRAVVATDPGDPDVHVQLGHVFKLRGRRAEALAAYRKALSLDPACAPAAIELAAMGDAAAQERVFRANVSRGSTEELIALSGEVAALRDLLDRLAARLPDIADLAATPVSLYARYRERFTIPSPPPGQLAARPVHVVLLADRESLDTIHLQLAGLRGQSHTKWRLTVLGSNQPHREIITRAAASDQRVRWLEHTGPTPLAELRAATEGSGTVVLLAAGAVLDSQGLSWIAAAFEHTRAQAFVCDHEFATSERGHLRYHHPAPRGLPDYDTMLERNVLGETVACEVATLRDLAPRLQTESVTASRVSLLLALTKRGAVGHIPYPLVWHAREESTAETVAGHAGIVRRHLEQARSPATLVSATGDAPIHVLWKSEPTTVAVIVPTRDNAQDVEKLVESLRFTADDPGALDILVLDNGGAHATDRATLERMEAEGLIRLSTIDEPFNWSRMNNQGAALTEAPLLVFVNDDIRMMSHGWDVLMRGLLGRPEVGALGARLLYPDESLQHAGIMFGWSPSPTHHDGLHEAATTPGPAWRWRVTRGVSAVTGAFLATRRDNFISMGGFDEAALPVGYSDIDYALKLRAAGLKILWTPHISMYHLESKTRGVDVGDPAKIARERAECDVVLQRWPGVFDSDPTVHPIWHPATLPFRLLRPYSADRAMRHVRATATPEPWMVASPLTAPP